MGTSDHIGISTADEFPAVNWKVFEMVLGLLQKYWAKELDLQNHENSYVNYTRFLAALKSRVTQWEKKERSPILTIMYPRHDKGSP